MTDDERRRAVSLARRALEARVRRTPAPSAERGGEFDRHAGAFVTIYANGELRGCLGRIDTRWPLGRTIAHLGEAVADEDPRFPAVVPAELSAIDVEVSVLTPERDVRRLEEIEVGRHGLIVEQGVRLGLLLPQVATGRNWSAREFVEQTCVKAGLPRDAWERGARLLVFEAEVFGER